MKNDDSSFVDFIVDDQLETMDVRAVRMFGSYGLYHENAFFGIISKSELFFKTSAKTREKYIEYGMTPFSPSKLQVMSNYLQVPTDIIEDREQLREWALEAARCDFDT